jgi:AraC family transcriptional regulator
VIHYLEKVVFDGSEIDYNEISKIAASPAALFQRIFIFVSGVSISDYVRKRKMTLAAHDLKTGDISVLDAAVKYGFGSHSSFTRAFKEHHGITPSEAKTAQFNDYLPINFSEMRFIGGKRIMAEMKKITYKETPERMMAGYHHETNFFEVGEAWRAKSPYEKIREIDESQFCCDDIDPCDSIGFMYNFTGTNNFHFIIGDFVKPDTPLPEDFTVHRVPAGTTAHVQIEGANVGEIIASAYMLITEAIEKTGKKIDFDNFYWCEVYTLERYCEPLKRGEKVTIDYIMPVSSP